VTARAAGPTALVALVAAGLLAGAPPSHASDEPLGPEIGSSNAYRAHIVWTSLGGEDVDEYHGRLIQGERLSVSVLSPFQSPLFPEVQFVDPTGAERTPPVRVRRLGKAVSVRKFEIDAGGVWRVRVRGLYETQGPYRVQFRTRSPAPQRFDVPAVPETAEAVLVVREFQAVDGAELTLSLRSARRGPPATLAELTGPSGDEVPGAHAARAVEDAQVRGRNVRLRRVSLGQGTGAYVVAVRVPPGGGGGRVRLRVVPPRRPRGLSRLTRDEPWLEPRNFPLRTAHGVRMKLVGRHFHPDARVFFGNERALEVTPDNVGASLEVVVPPGVPGTVVRVAVVNPDRQASVREAFAEYVLPPVLSDVTDLDGVPVRAAATTGGRRLRVHGADFATGHIVRFGTRDVLPVPIDATLLEIVTPAHAAGEVPFTVVDSYGNVAELPELFEFKTPPSFAAEPYSPASAAPGTLVTLSGSGFEFEDELVLGGVAVHSTRTSSGTRIFYSPARPPGPVVVELVDRIGTLVRGPDFQVEAGSPPD
jgi:hypothetical protein